MHTLDHGTEHAASKQQNPLYLYMTAHTHAHECVRVRSGNCSPLQCMLSHSVACPHLGVQNQPITPARPTHCNRQPSSSFGPTVWPSLPSAATPPLHSTLTTLPSPPSLTASAHVAAIVRASLDRISVISIFFCSSSSAALPA